MFKKGVENFVSWVIKHYKIVFVLVLVFTLFTSYITYKRFKIKTSLTVLLPEKQESVVNLKELQKRKGSTDNLIIVLENDNLDQSKEFSKEIYKALKDDPLILSIEHYKDVSFLKNRLLLQLSVKELTKIRTKIKEKISKTKFDKVTDLGLDDEDINPELADSDGDILDGEGDPFKNRVVNKSNKLPKLTFEKKDENDPLTKVETYIEEDEDIDEDVGTFDDEGDPFKKGFSSKENKREKKESILKSTAKNKNESSFLSYIDNRFNSYRESFSGRFREWRVSNNEKVLVIMITPAKPAANVDFAKKIGKHLKNVIKEIKNKHPEYNSIKVGYSGSYITILSETDEIKHDIISSIGLSIFLIFLLLYFYFGRKRAIITLFIPLLLGMIWASGVYFLFDSYLNLIAAFIFAILLGLGIDFGIHILTRYFEEKKNHSMEEAIIISLTNTGKSIIIGGLTTIAAFISLIFADFKGFSQFGILASLGIALNLVAIYIVFPLLIILFEKHGSFKESRNFYIIIYKKVFTKKSRFDFMKLSKYALFILFISFFGLTARVILKAPKFEYNFAKLNKKGGKKKRLVSKYSSATKRSLSPIVVMTDSAQETKDIHDVLTEVTKYNEDIVRQPAIFPILKPYDTLVRYNNTKTIKMIASIYSFFPDNQKEKQKILEDIDGMLTPSRLKHLTEDELKTIKEMRPYLQKAKAFKIDELPEFVKNIFKDKNGNYDRLLLIYVKVNTTNGRNAIKFAKEIRSIRVNGKKLKATGQPLIFADILLLMIKDSINISGLAFIFIVLILLIFNRSIKRTSLTLIPLILGMLLTLFFMSLFDIRVNFFNMSVIPALIGMGIDNSVHFLHAVDESNEKNVIFAYKKIIGSITMATFSTIIGFAGLLTANHKGLNTIGELAIIGMLSMWLVILVPMPIFVQYLQNRKK